MRIVPSPAAIRAGKAAAKSPHGLINLIRLVNSLDNASLELNLDDDDDKEEFDKTVIQVTKDEQVNPIMASVGSNSLRQTAAYAQVMLDALKEENEGLVASPDRQLSSSTSTTSDTLNDLQTTLSQLEDRYIRALAPKIPTIPLSKTLSRVSATSSKAGQSSVRNSRPATPVIMHQPPMSRPEPPRSPSPPQVVRKRKNPPLSTYLQARRNEDAGGLEDGLLPVRIKPKPVEKSNRDQLLGASGTGMGAAQLHEELGGQLADVSSQDFPIC